MVKINSVEAEKRNLLIQEYEIHDRRVRDEAKNENVRLNELKRLQYLEEIELKNRAEEKLKRDKINNSKYLLSVRYFDENFFMIIYRHCC